jgi:hypothetical protein
MPQLITFKSAKFDVSAETPNPINPIAGESLLKWLRSELTKHQFDVTEPDAEDWGWYVSVHTPQGSYMVGASADAEESQPPVEWTVQLHKQRSMKDKLLGRNKQTPDDVLLAVVERAIRNGADASDVLVDRDA